jgi:hypothetical protein
MVGCVTGAGASSFLTVSATAPAEEGHQAIARGGVAGDVDERGEALTPRVDVENW